MQIIAMWTLGGVRAMHKDFTYYASRGVMLDAFLYLLSYSAKF